MCGVCVCGVSPKRLGLGPSHHTTTGWGTFKQNIMFAAIVASLLGAIPEHEVHSLPGWTDPLPSKQSVNGV